MREKHGAKLTVFLGPIWVETLVILVTQRNSAALVVKVI